jgi:hypothetical protein
MLLRNDQKTNFGIKMKNYQTMLISTLSAAMYGNNIKMEAFPQNI